MLQNRNVFLLLFAQACFLAVSMTAVTFSGLAGKLLAADPKFATLPTSLVIAATALSTGPMSMLMQRYSRRFGFRLGAGFGLLAGLVASASLYFGDFYMLCAAMALLGPFQSSAQYYRFAAAESVPATHAPRALSLVLVGGLIAAVFAPSATLYLNDSFAPYSFMGAFVFVVMMTTLIFVPIAFLKPLDKPLTVQNTEDKGETRPLSKIVRTPKFIVAVINGALGFAMMSFVMTATPLAIEACGFGTNVSARVIQGHVIAMFLPSLFTGHLISRFGLVPILLLGHVMFAIAFITALSGIQIWQFSVALIALGLGWNFCFIGGSSLLTQVHSDAEKGRVQGLNEFLVFGMSAVASFAAGIILDTYGWSLVNQAAFVMLVIASLVTLWWALWLEPRKAASLVN
ncbi:MFS transporter [Kordiimonas laminariae]|uniref:MFS transporter n=1 Tax=Kordiimonas laminariae TaxID=2917717 RepID=UPI0031BAC5CF